MSISTSTRAAPVLSSAACLASLLCLPFLSCLSSRAWAQAASEAAPTIPRAYAPPTLRRFVEPDYPEAGRRRGQGGTVTLRLRIDARGAVTDVAVVRGLGAEFDQAAVRAGRRLEFDPGVLAGEAVSTTIDFEYRFTPPGHTHTAATGAGAPLEAGGSSEATAAGPLEVKRTETVTVVDSVAAERPSTAASARTVRDRDLRLRPTLRPGDLFRVTPGLMIVQHAGGGKANQYLLRGFDADHGTDVAFTFDGVPINMVSHGHGQGYADANFLIPELIERVEITKGPYFVEQGDFASAGAIDLVTREGGESFVSFGGGSFDTLRSVAIVSPRFMDHVKPLFAVEAMQTNGPFDNPERFKKYNLFTKLTFALSSESSLFLAASAYSGSWRASGQLPGRAVRAGLVDFFGALDPSEGGATSREDLYVNYRLRPSAGSELHALAYVSRYGLDLFSNFTLFSRDPVGGDQIEQWDDRSMAGGRARYRWLRQWRGILFDSSVGGDARSDDIANGLAYTRARQRARRVVEASILESSVGAYAKQEVQLARWLRLVGGLRTDHFNFRVDDRLEALDVDAGATSGIRGATLTSPKASIVVSPHATTDLFLNYGAGLHSNDARGVVRVVAPVTPLTRSFGYEIGARTRLLDRRLELAVALWGLDLDSEVVWIGDEGTTEAAGATRRLGLEVEGRWELRPWLFADLDVTFTDAKFREDAGAGRAIPLAPRLTAAGGLSALHPSGLRGGLRVQYVAARPATEDESLTAESMTLADAFVAYRAGSFELALSVENLLDRRTKAAQFATVSRLPGEAATNAPPPPGACPSGTRAATGGEGSFQGCEDVSFSPGNPLGARVMGTYYF
jgi:TonB family protein